MINLKKIFFWLNPIIYKYVYHAGRQDGFKSGHSAGCNKHNSTCEYFRRYCADQRWIDNIISNADSQHEELGYQKGYKAGIRDGYLEGFVAGKTDS